MFNNREIAVAVWVGLIAGWLLTRDEIRVSALNLVRTLLSWKFVSCLASMCIYTTLVTGLLYASGVWTPSMAKDTLVWLLAIAPIVLNCLGGRSYSNEIFRRVITDAFKATALVELFMESYTLPLIGELILFPIVTSLAVVAAFGQKKKETANVAKVASVLLIAIIMMVICNCVLGAITDNRNLGTITLARGIGYPPLMSILTIPFMLATACFRYYDEIFIRINTGCNSNFQLRRYAKWRIFLYCGFSLVRLNSIRDCTSGLMRINSVRDIDRLLHEKHFVSPM